MGLLDSICSTSQKWKETVEEHAFVDPNKAEHDIGEAVDAFRKNPEQFFEATIQNKTDPKTEKLITFLESAGAEYNAVDELSKQNDIDTFYKLFRTDKTQNALLYSLVENNDHLGEKIALGIISFGLVPLIAYLSNTLWYKPKEFHSKLEEHNTRPEWMNRS